MSSGRDKASEGTMDGYRGPGRALRERHGVSVWSDVEGSTTDGHFRGIILPRSETKRRSFAGSL